MYHISAEQQGKDFIQYTSSCLANLSKFSKNGAVGVIQNSWFKICTVSVQTVQTVQSVQH